MSDDARFEDLAGKTIVSITGLEVGSDRVTLETDDGSEYVMWHTQDCCESVAVEEIIGDVADVIGSPIVLAARVSESNDWPAGEEPFNERVDSESYTWTFYRLGTVKGTVVIRWFGSSNGYYSESVDFMQTRGEAQSAEASS